MEGGSGLHLQPCEGVLASQPSSESGGLNQRPSASRPGPLHAVPLSCRSISTRILPGDEISRFSVSQVTYVFPAGVRFIS